MKKRLALLALLALVLALTLAACSPAGEMLLPPPEPAQPTVPTSEPTSEPTPEATPEPTPEPAPEPAPEPVPAEGYTLDALPAWDGTAYVVLGDNVPDFPPSERTTQAYEYYSPLDSLGRCGAAVACVGQELMPTQDRGSISQVKPSGWHSVTYDCIAEQHLYNRCHLIGYQLTGENANEENLITGTRYLNVEGMLPFENLATDYIRETGNHVLYRVTPVFQENDLVALGVRMEALSVEDEGAGVCFDVFCYNVQPGVVIDYATGESRAEDAPAEGETMTYVLNTSSHKFHDPSCSSVADIQPDNREDYTGTRELLLAQGYAPCGRCQP